MSEALRLAELLTNLKITVKGRDNAEAMEEAAAELRRLHAENEALKADTKSLATMSNLWAKEKAINAELVEALRIAVDSDLGAKWVWHESGKEAWITYARAALAKVEASK